MKPFLSLLAALPLSAALTTVHVTGRADVLGGRTFGKAGAYERIVAKAYFAVDPRLPANRIITDLRYAPVNEEGKVEFSSDVYVLKPRDPAKGNGTVLFEVSNRGGRGLPGTFNYGAKTEEGLGDGFLLEQGFTLVWVGWQFDVAERDGLLRVLVPAARGVSGLVRAEVVVTEKTGRFSVGDRGHIPYPAADPSEPDARMFVREWADGPRTTVPRSQWRFTDPVTIAVEGEFLPNRRYEVVYTSKDPGVAGLGSAAIRDFLSFLKYGGGARTAALGDQRRFLKRAIGFGSSQSGRFLRDFLYQGFNADEQGRQVFDGLMPHIAGGGRGSFHHRFAQPSRLGPYYPTDLFPFRDLPDADSETGAHDGILRAALAANTVPKIFYTNTSNEYWRISASLLHTSLDGGKDEALAPSTRVYFLAGTQHGAGAWPPARSSGLRYASNANDYRPILRALLVAMNEWLTSGKEPPPSRIPMIAPGQLAKPGHVRYPAIPGLLVPTRIWRAHRLDFGPDFLYSGVIANEPAQPRGEPYTILLPQVDADGNELAGIRNPVVSVPLATYAGWNLNVSSTGPDREIAGLVGSYMPFAASKAERERSGDARLSIEERYRSREDYLARVSEASKKLASERYLLETDIPRILERSAAEWNERTK